MFGIWAIADLPVAKIIRVLCFYSLIYLIRTQVVFILAAFSIITYHCHITLTKYTPKLSLR